MSGVHTPVTEKRKSERNVSFRNSYTRDQARTVDAVKEKLSMQSVRESESLTGEATRDGRITRRIGEFHGRGEFYLRNEEEAK